jgi:hypothetical protein
MGDPNLRHPDIELVDPPEFPDVGRHVGEDALRQRVEGFVELGWDGRYRVEEFVDAGNEVIAIWKAKGSQHPRGGSDRHDPGARVPLRGGKGSSDEAVPEPS